MLLVWVNKMMFSTIVSPCIPRMPELMHPGLLSAWNIIVWVSYEHMCSHVFACSCRSPDAPWGSSLPSYISPTHLEALRWEQGIWRHRGLQQVSTRDPLFTPIYLNICLVFIEWKWEEKWYLLLDSIVLFLNFISVIYQCKIVKIQISLNYIERMNYIKRMCEPQIYLHLHLHPLNVSTWNN